MVVVAPVSFSASLYSSTCRLRFPFRAFGAPFPSRRIFPPPVGRRRPATRALASSAASSSRKPWLLVGLGNPGKIFHGTRHNVGFEMIDAIAEAEGISMGSISYKSVFGKGFIGDNPVMLAKPQTYMNASGESVGSLVSYYKVPLEQVLVIYDDLDLPFAKLRLLPKGGHGGHNGMRSVIKHFKDSRDFPRLRVGIGRPPGKMDSAAFVVRSFNKTEREELDFTIQKGVDAARILLLEGFDKSATFVNATARPPRSEPTNQTC